jgi:hypothetical protein
MRLAVDAGDRAVRVDADSRVSHAALRSLRETKDDRSLHLRCSRGELTYLRPVNVHRQLVEVTIRVAAQVQLREDREVHAGMRPDRIDGPRHVPRHVANPACKLGEQRLHRSAPLGRDPTSTFSPTSSCSGEMRMRGLEPPRPFGHTDLNRARLPIPPHPRGRGDFSWRRCPAQWRGRPSCFSITGRLSRSRWTLAAKSSSPSPWTTVSFSFRRLRERTCRASAPTAAIRRGHSAPTTTRTAATRNTIATIPTPEL